MASRRLEFWREEQSCVVACGQADLPRGSEGSQGHARFEGGAAGLNANPSTCVILLRNVSLCDFNRVFA